MAKLSRLIMIAAFLAPLFVLQPLANAQVQSSPTSFTLLTDEVVGDFKYMVDNARMDAVDIATSPLYIASDNSVFRSPSFYIAAAEISAAWGVSFAADQTVRSHLRDMSSSTANELQTGSYAVVGAAAALTYAYGLYADDRPVRETILTSAEGAGLATLLAIALKPAFGRLRPHQDGHHHTTFFDGGASFPSGEVTPMFALAAGVSESFDNKWYVAIPIYSAALADGFGRMGHDSHWLSDVVGAAVLGWGTTEVLLYLHREHSGEQDRWRIFPVSGNTRATRGSETPMGLGVSYNW